MSGLEKHKNQAFYRLGSFVRLREDECHEFKMHVNMSAEDIADSRKKYKRAVSRNINGFLNSGRGGIIYLGIANNTTVNGIPLSCAQKEHICVSLDDVLGRYSPPVPPTLYTVVFVPVVKDEAELVKTVKGFNRKENKRMARPHLLRTSSPCWCMTSAGVAFGKWGTEYPRYVVEVHIKPTKPETVFTVEGVAVKLKPLFADEEGNCYFRKAASVWQYSFQELSQHITSEVTRCFTEEIQRLEKELRDVISDVQRKAKTRVKSPDWSLPPLE